MRSGRKLWSVNLLSLFFLLAVLSDVGIAESFPFRNVKLGSELPNINLVHYKAKSQFTTQDIKGKNVVLLFWGADTNIKKKRTIKAFQKLAKVVPTLKQQGVPFITVNVLNDSAEVIEDILKKSKSDLPVYYDRGGNLYGELGLFVMPCILVADGTNKLAAGIPYSRNMNEVVEGEIAILSGKKSRAQVEQELHPEMVEKSPEAKESLRRFNLGMTMIKRGILESAIREFEKAIELDPSMAQAYIEVGCLYLDVGKKDLAATSLSKGLDLDDSAVKGLICQARLQADEGDLDGALQELQGLMLRNSRNPDLRYTLGTIYEKQGQMEKAAGEFRKAYELLSKEANKE